MIEEDERDMKQLKSCADSSTAPSVVPLAFRKKVGMIGMVDAFATDVRKRITSPSTARMLQVDEEKGKRVPNKV